MAEWRPGFGSMGADPYGYSNAVATTARGDGRVAAQPGTRPFGGGPANDAKALIDRYKNSKAFKPTGSAPPPPPLGGGQDPFGKNSAPAAAAPTPATGTESGPGILENWFAQRASGTDPAFEYTSRRGMDAIDNRMAAGGSFNSGARGQQLSDFAANMGAQRQGQLDSLAAGAAGEHRGRLNDMFQQMLGLSSGQAGLAGAYDISAANGMSASDNAILQMMLNKAGVESKADQGLLNNIFSALSLGKAK